MTISYLYLSTNCWKEILIIVIFGFEFPYRPRGEKTPHRK